MKEKTPDPVEIAQKQRHLYLLTKVRDNRHISRAELKELNELEEKMTDERAQELKSARAKNTASRAEVADAEIIGSQAEAALFLGKSTRTIRRYEKEGMPTAVRNGKKVYIKSILLLYAANEGKKPTQAKIKKEEGSAELTATRAENERFDLEIKKGEWIKKDETERDELRKITTVKRALLGQGRKLAMQLATMTDPRKIQALLDKENKAIIEGFSR